MDIAKKNAQKQERAGIIIFQIASYLDHKMINFDCIFCFLAKKQLHLRINLQYQGKNNHLERIKLIRTNKKIQQSQKINQIIMIKITKVKILLNLPKKTKMEKLNRKSLMTMLQVKIKLLSNLKEKKKNQRKNELKRFICCSCDFYFQTYYYSYSYSSIFLHIITMS